MCFYVRNSPQSSPATPGPCNGRARGLVSSGNLNSSWKVSRASPDLSELSGDPSVPQRPCQSPRRPWGSLRLSEGLRSS
eukprot:1729408-Alexandrium_andersonii.AAC.1